MSAINDIEAERAVLAAALQVPTVLRDLLGDVDLRPDHFFYDTHQRIYRAMVELHDAGDAIDQLTISRAIRGDDATNRAFAVIPATYADLNGYRTHAKRVKRCAHLERQRAAGLAIANAAELEDEDGIARAEQQLTAHEGGDSALLSVEDRRQRALDRLQNTTSPTMPLPWPRINKLIGGGMWPGRYALLGGWTAHGKSAAIDQALEYVADRGKNVAVYLTETTEEERTNRSIARVSGIPLSALQERTANTDDVIKAIGQLPNVALVEAHDWTVAEIARHISRHRWDFCGVDILHDIQHREERDLAEIGRTLLQTAKRTRTAIMACVHLNDNRVHDVPPPPVNRDVRGSGMLIRQADLVLMVFQQEDDDGPTGDGLLRVTKCRQGRTGAERARFQGNRQRWMALDPVAV